MKATLGRRAASFLVLCSLVACADEPSGRSRDAGLEDATVADARSDGSASVDSASSFDADTSDAHVPDASGDEPLDAATPSTEWLLPEAHWGVPLTGEYDCYRSVDNDYRCGGDPSHGSGTGMADLTVQFTRTADGYTADVADFYATVPVSTGGASSPLIPAVSVAVTFDADPEATTPAGLGTLTTTSAIGANPYIVDMTAVRVTSNGVVVVRDYRSTLMACNEIVDHVTCTARWYVPEP